MLQRYSTVKQLSGQLISIIKSRGTIQTCYSDCATTVPRAESRFLLGQSSLLPFLALADRSHFLLSFRKPISETAEGILNNSTNLNLTNDMIMLLSNSKGNCNQPRTPARNGSCTPKKDECAQEQEEYTITPCCRPFKLQKEHPMKDTCKKKNKRC